MKIYTKTGDKGTTSLFGAKRVLKSNIQVEAYGSIDELSSFLGLVLTKKVTKSHKELLTQCQKDLHLIMGYVCGARSELREIKARIKLFEQTIDNIQSNLPELHRFILPQGSELSCLLHIARTLCRKAERRVVEYFYKTKTNEIILQYLNRFSDLLFILARFHNSYEIFA